MPIPMRLPFLFLLVLSAILLRAERIAQETDLYDIPNKRLMARFYKGSGCYLDTTEQHGWVKVIFTVFVPKANFNASEQKLAKNTILYDVLGQETGRVFSEVRINGNYIEEDTRFGIEMAGYIQKTALDTNFIPEQLLEKYFRSKAVIFKDDLAPVLEKLYFKSKTSAENILVYELNEIKGINKRNIIPRMKLVFFRDAKSNKYFLALLAPSRKMKIGYYEAMVQEKDRMYYFFGNFNNDQKEKMINAL